MVGGDGRALVVFPLVSGVDHVNFPAHVCLRVALEKKTWNGRGLQKSVVRLWLDRVRLSRVTGGGHGTLG